jgi:hypothetical protein
MLAPPPIEFVIRDALKDAFDHSAPAKITWVDATPITVQVTTDAAGVRNIEIRAPAGMNIP